MSIASEELETLVKEFETIQAEISDRKEALKKLGAIIEGVRASGGDASRAERTHSVIAAVIDVLEEEGAKVLNLLEEQASSRLRGVAQVRTIGTVQPATNRSQGATISEAKIQAPTLFQAHLIEKGLSLPEWVLTKSNFKLKENTVQSWVKPGDGGRRIPREWADRIAAEFNDPRLRKPENWPKGIRELRTIRRK